MVRIVCDFCRCCERYGNGCIGASSFPDNCIMASPEKLCSMMSDDEFYNILDDIVYDLSTDELMAIPGIRDILADHFTAQINNIWADRYLLRFR